MVSDQVPMNDKKKKSHDQLNLLVYEGDRTRLDHLRVVTGLGTQSEIMRYALEYTVEHLPTLLHPYDANKPALLHHIAGLTGLLEAFLTTVSRQLDTKSEKYLLLVSDLLRNIGDAIEVCSLFAEYLGDQMIVWNGDHAIHFRYEAAIGLLAGVGIDLDSRSVPEGQRENSSVVKAVGLYLDDLFKVYIRLLEEYLSSGEYTHFVIRLRRYAETILTRKTREIE